MTCIVGVENDQKVYIGGDAACSDENSIVSLSESKVFKIGDMLFGFCGSLRIGQILRHGLKLPVHSKSKSDMSYLVIDVVDEIRSLLNDKGSLKKDGEIEVLDEASLLIGYRGKIYYIDSDFQVGRSNTGYYAIGAGADLALGSLFTTQNLISDPKTRIDIALKASAQFNSSVRPPFTQICLNPSKTKGK